MSNPTRSRNRPRKNNLCLGCGQQYERPAHFGARGYCPNCKQPHRLSYFSIYRKRTREEAIRQYGGRCLCCGEAEFAFLALDHIDGGGNEHRRQRKGDRLCQWLKSRGWPTGYQVLCHNCNAAKGIYGQCPHTKLNAKSSIWTQDTSSGSGKGFVMTPWTVKINGSSVRLPTRDPVSPSGLLTT